MGDRRSKGDEAAWSMSLPVVLGEAAEAEFDEAVDWYEQRAGLGFKFVASVREVLARIGSSPELHAIVRNDVRRSVMRGFPYSVYYRLQTDRVEVVAIFHSRREPSEGNGEYDSRSRGKRV